MVLYDYKTQPIDYVLSVGIDFGFHLRCLLRASLELLVDRWIHLFTAIVAAIIVVVIKESIAIELAGTTIKDSGEGAAVASEAIVPVSAKPAEVELAIRPSSTFAAKLKEEATA